MSQDSVSAIADVVSAVESSRVRNVPGKIVEPMRRSNLHSAINGMFYTGPSVMFTSVEVSGVNYFTLGFSEEGISGRYLVSRSGEVSLLGPEGEFRFVNSQLGVFLRFLEDWHRFVSIPAPRDSEGELDEDAVIGIGMDLKESLEGLDEAAFSSEETWWSLVFEEVELGTLGPL